MFPNEKARLMRMMDSHGVPAEKESGAKMDFTQRVTWLIEHANQPRVQADVAYCSCKSPIPAHKNSVLICADCKKPQHR